MDLVSAAGSGANGRGHERNKNTSGNASKTSAHLVDRYFRLSTTNTTEQFTHIWPGDGGGGGGRCGSGERERELEPMDSTMQNLGPKKN